MSFSEMMQQAIQIRTTTDAKLRVDFDSRPKFQQSSMFATQEVRDARGLPLQEMLAVCTAMKLRGNDQMRIGSHDKACQTYEQALAMLWYLDNRNDSWKTSGIKDEDITEVNFRPTCGIPAFEDETRALKVALLLNIARAYSTQSDYATSVKACGAALSTDPSCTKALYLRGKALVAPASAGAFETEEAIRDVSRAADLAPGDNLIRAFLAKLRAEKARQKEADRATFAGMFDRGTVCDPEAESKPTPHAAPTHGDGNAKRGVLRSSAKAEERGEASNEGPGDGGSSRQENDTGGGSDEAGQAGRGDSGRRAAGRKTLEMRRDVEERVAFLKGLARECDDEGREEEAGKYRERVGAIEDILLEHDRQEKERAAGLRESHAEVDWRNPSEAMRKKAVEEEYDLNNPAVISFLVKMQEGYQAEREAQGRRGFRHGDGGGCRTDGEGDDGDSGSSVERESIRSDAEGGDQENWTEEVWEGAILCMTRPEVTSLLKDELGVDPQTDTPLRELRNLATSKLLGERSSAERMTSASSAGSDDRPKGKRADWKITAAISFLLFAFKAYQMGLLKWMLTGGTPTAGAVGMSGGAASMANSGKGVGQGAEAARGRRGRRGWERRPSSSATGARGGTSVAGDGADSGGSSLAAQALASAAQAAPTSEEENHDGWCGSSIDVTCVAGAGGGEKALNPAAEDEFEFFIDHSGGDVANDEHEAV